jgi:phosphodiesterase/alkaline phosphatase D-like protein
MKRLLLCTLLIVGCARTPPPDDVPPAIEPAPIATESLLSHGPVLRSVDARSARFLFRAAKEEPWTAGLEIGTSLETESLLPVAPLEVGPETGFVAQLTVAGLEPQTRYTYVPLVDGRRAFDDPELFGSFVTPPDLGPLNADFTVAWLADQHTADTAEPSTFEAYNAAARSRPLFWAQLGDVAASTLEEGRLEADRTLEELREIWRRNYGDPASPQSRFAASYSLNLATISDHELYDNFNMNWHDTMSTAAGTSTLHDRVALYDRSIGEWWNHLGWGPSFADRLGQAARADHGESVMAEPAVPLLEPTSDRAICIANGEAPRFRAGTFVYLAEETAPVFHSRVQSAEEEGDCAGGEGTQLILLTAPPDVYSPAGGEIGIGARYARHGHYHAYRPFPYVEFLLLDTTSYRGDPYQERALYDRKANYDTDHSRYPWSNESATIFDDRNHGANRTTDAVRSWLGPAQKEALFEALATSEAELLVVAAGYPLYSAKFEWSERYWPGRESGFDYATELEEIVAALEGTGKLVLWVHGDGHTPMLVRLRPNLYQLQTGPTLMGHTGSPGHRSRTLASGDRAQGELLGGHELIAGHQPDLNLGDEVEDIFGEHLDQFEGYLRLYFHPGREALRNSERSGLRRGESDREVRIPTAENPARGGAGQHIVGRVVRLHFGDERRHSIVTGHRYAEDQVQLELADPIVVRDPDALRIVLDGDPWIEATWVDTRGHEWREFSRILRHAQ